MTTNHPSIPLTRRLAMAVLVLLMLPTAQAAVSWQINPAGTGAADATTVSAIDVGGSGFVQILPNADGSFTFVEHGAYQALQSDRLTPFGSQDITVTYSVTGTGSFVDPLALRFTTGSIDLYADPTFDFGTAAGTYGADNGTHIARFDIFGGGATPTGMVSLSARLTAGSLARGYFFTAGGDDLADTARPILTLGIYNEPVLVPDSLLVSEIACSMAAYGGPGCNGTPYAYSPFAFAVHDGGFASITAVPEPATGALLLAGLGLLSFAVKRSRQA